ncbi:aldo/keto reductase [Streptomyces sp. NBC_01264]|uniref:aldo/keto reductase n=1 Tax=Streptomyces sp. NBC_01264 TaxID=2903804 RepID=UPI002B1E76E1|nr:aldo/keto reductase [Streptomyces sp. NBC_01264]
MGTWQLSDDQSARTVSQAAKLGYRLIDTASQYGNERGVGEGIRASGISRDEFFIISKLNGADQGYDRALRGFDESLERLGLDRLDMYLIHWPMPRRGLYVDTWRAFIRLLNEGRVSAIGVSNFTSAHLDRLAAATGVLPAVDQVQLNPRVAQRALRRHATHHNVVVQSWGPLGQGGSLLEDPVVRRLAVHHGKSPGQIVLRWHLDENLIPIAKSANLGRLAQNIDVFDFHLTREELLQIAALDGRENPIDPDEFEQD